jgi:uridine phosphorylase
LDDLQLGSLVIAETVLARDGVSRALGATELAPDGQLLAALRAAGNGAAFGAVLSADRHDGAPAAADGAVAIDLTSGAVLAVAAAHGVAAASVLLVSDRRGDRLEPEALERAEVELGRVGAAALS